MRAGGIRDRYAPRSFRLAQKVGESTAPAHARTATLSARFSTAASNAARYCALPIPRLSDGQPCYVTFVGHAATV